MKKFSVNLVMPLLVIIGFLFIAASVPQDKAKKPWNVPEKYLKMKNPQKAGDAEMVKLGKAMYAKHCKSCHGSIGAGDGPKAAQLKTKVPDFTKPAFQALKDGELYYMSFVGKDEMPNFEKKVTSEEERWAIITYMKATFKK